MDENLKKMQEDVVALIETTNKLKQGLKTLDHSVI